MCHDLVQVLREGVIVIARCWLAGPAEPPAIVRDDPIPCIQQGRHLLFPRSTAQRIAVDKNDGVTGAMIFIVDLDVTRVFFADRNIWHGGSPFRSFVSQLGRGIGGFPLASPSTAAIALIPKSRTSRRV